MTGQRLVWFVPSAVMGSDFKTRTGGRVILVEDSPFDAELIEGRLKDDLGCNVVVLYSREMFLAELDHAQPALIVSDSNLPTFDGFEALRIAQEKWPEVPFVFCSGQVTKDLEAVALARGAKACVNKDDLDRLVSVVRDLCEEAG